MVEVGLQRRRYVEGLAARDAVEGVQRREVVVGPAVHALRVAVTRAQQIDAGAAVERVEPAAAVKLVAAVAA